MTLHGYATLIPRVCVQATTSHRRLCSLPLLLAGCSGGGRDEGRGRRDGAEHRPAGRPGRAVAHALDEELAEIEPTEHRDVDVAFMQGMIHHHAQALRMTALVPHQRADAKVELLASASTSRRRARSSR